MFDKEYMKQVAIDTLKIIIKGIENEDKVYVYHHLFEDVTDEGEEIDRVYFKTKEGIEFTFTELNQVLFEGLDPIEIIKKWAPRV